jgi:hypothetical protein
MSINLLMRSMSGKIKHSCLSGLPHRCCEHELAYAVLMALAVALQADSPMTNLGTAIHQESSRFDIKLTVQLLQDASTTNASPAWLRPPTEPVRAAAAAPAAPAAAGPMLLIWIVTLLSVSWCSVWR